MGIVYGALCALVQKDLKKLVAYTSVNHMGFVLLAIGAYMIAPNPDVAGVALQGAIVVMFSHGVTTGLLFLLVGYIYERTHTREISELPGMGGKIPVIAIMLIIASFASIGLPALSGFVGEFTLASSCIRSHQVVGMGIHRWSCCKCRRNALDEIAESYVWKSTGKI
ncbi:MAG: proton-conducting transporter membrane subunit [Caldisericia bacterium]